MLKVYAKKTGVKIRYSTGCTYHTPKPITNADRIRAMTGEELAAWIAEHPVVTSYDNDNPQHRKWLDWLKEEASE